MSHKIFPYHALNVLSGQVDISNSTSKSGH